MLLADTPHLLDFRASLQKKYVNFENERVIMKKYLCIVAVLGLLLMTSCSQSKSQVVIEEFENLVEEVESKKGKLTVEEWKELDKEFNERFEKLGIDNIDETEFSTMEKIKLAALTMRWTAAMAESAPTLMEGVIEEVERQQSESE